MSQLNDLFPPRPAVVSATQPPADATRLPVSFVGKSGRFYIRQCRADGSGHHHRLTIWPSTDAYDRRMPVLLSFCDAADALSDFSHPVNIYPESLTTTPPAYPPDRDETDFGLTPQRNVWRNKLAQTRQRHAA